VKAEQGLYSPVRQKTESQVEQALVSCRPGRSQVEVEDRECSAHGARVSRAEAVPIVRQTMNSALVGHDLLLIRH
jgi:hypothetical protein